MASVSEMLKEFLSEEGLKGLLCLLITNRRSSAYELTHFFIIEQYAGIFSFICIILFHISEIDPSVYLDFCLIIYMNAAY